MKNNKFMIVLIAIIIGLAGYICFDKVVSKDTNTSKVGTYINYRGYQDEQEYTLTLFYTDDKNNGYFTLVEASTMSFNQVSDGYYTIKDQSIEFYQNINDEEKNNFVNAFFMEEKDLYQDKDALKEGYSKQYRLKLNYNDDAISNKTITLEKM